MITNTHTNTNFLTFDMVNDIHQMWWYEDASFADIKEVYNLQTNQIRAILRTRKLIIGLYRKEKI